MSLTSEFHGIADWVAGHALRNEPIEPHAAGHLAAVLLDLADRAKLLQQLPVTVLFASEEHDCSG